MHEGCCLSEKFFHMAHAIFENHQELEFPKKNFVRLRT